MYFKRNRISFRLNVKRRRGSCVFRTWLFCGAMRKPIEFVDKWGLLDKHYLPDGGDTCQREGMFFALLGMQKKEECFDGMFMCESRYRAVMDKLHPSPGLLLRHSWIGYDASDWDRMSRDQFQPMVIAAGYYGGGNDLRGSDLQRLRSGHLKRGFLFTSNTRKNGATKENHGQFSDGEVRDYSWKFPDLTGPEVWGNFIRAFNAWYLFPLLILFDLELLFGAIRWRVAPKHNIAMNHTLSQLQAMDRFPTPVSWLARMIMPVPKLIVLIRDHFNDFPDDMEFFGDMFQEAYDKIHSK